MEIQTQHVICHTSATTARIQIVTDQIAHEDPSSVPKTLKRLTVLITLELRGRHADPRDLLASQLGLLSELEAKERLGLKKQDGRQLRNDT